MAAAAAVGRIYLRSIFFPHSADAAAAAAAVVFVSSTLFIIRVETNCVRDRFGRRAHAARAALSREFRQNSTRYTVNVENNLFHIVILYI